MADITEQQFLAQDPEVLNYQRQRQLANLLVGGAFDQPQGQMISGHFVKPSGISQALPTIKATIGALTNANLDTKQQELLADRQLKQAELLRKFANAKTPQEKLAFATNPLAPKFLQTAAEEMFKPQKAGKGEIISQMDFGTGKYQPILQGAPDLPQGYNAAAWEQGVDLNNLPMGQRGNVANRAGEINRILHPGSNVIMPPAENAYSVEMGKGAAKQDLALKDIAENSTKTIENIHNQRKLLDTGKVITGFGADQRLGLAQFGKAVGLTGKGDEDLASNTQNFLAGRAGSTLDAIQSSNLGSAQGFSNTDREFLQAAKLGGIKYDEKSLRRQLDLEERVARAATEKWNERIKSMPKSASGAINMTPIGLPGAYQNQGVDTSNPLLNPKGF